jgi:hypothetical protein
MSHCSYYHRQDKGNLHREQIEQFDVCHDDEYSSDRVSAWQGEYKALRLKKDVETKSMSKQKLTLYSTLLLAMTALAYMRNAIVISPDFMKQLRMVC